MLTLTLAEVTWLLLVVAATTVGTLVACAWYLWRQERDLRALNEDVGALWAWCQAAGDAFGWGDDDGPGGDDDPPDDGGPPPPDALEDTAVAHPADTWARKAALLDRYTHAGQHRS